MKKYTSLTFKITGFSTVIVLLASIVVAFIVYFIADRFFLEAAQKGVNNETQLISNDIENSLTKVADNMVVLSKTPPIQGIVRSSQNAGMDTLEKSSLSMWRERLEIIFHSMLEVNKDYTQIRYVGVADGGKEIVRVNQNSQGIYRTHVSSLQQKNTREYFLEGIKLAQGSILFSRINYNQERGKVEEPKVVTLRVMTPVYTNRQKLFGLLIVNVNIKRYLRDILLRSAGKYDVILFDAYGDFFVYDHINKTLSFFEPGSTLPSGLLNGISPKTTADILPALTKNADRITVFRDIYATQDRSQKVLTVAISVPKSSITGEGLSFVGGILVWVLAVSLLSALAIFLFARRSMRPLSEMAKAIADTSRDLDEPLALPVELSDEVGMLARALDQKTKLLNKLALFDSLTGLANRKNFIDHLQDAIVRAKRHSHCVAVAYLDVNKFKEINDTYGHDYGDDLLVQFSSALREGLRENDFCARLGGDEFGLIIDEVESIDKLSPILETYANTMNKAYSIKGMTLSVVVSAGAAVYPDDASKISDLMKKADEAMYQSKQAGDGHFVRA